jgi:hypothetical protein
MPPPMISASTLSAGSVMTLTLSLTLAPPRIATNGRSGFASACPGTRFLLHQEAGHVLLEVLADHGRRGVRAVRGAEGVVDEDSPSPSEASFWPTPSASSSSRLGGLLLLVGRGLGQLDLAFLFLVEARCSPAGGRRRASAPSAIASVGRRSPART